MIFLLALIPATGLTIAGYIVWYLSARSEGRQRTFGRYLGYWAFTLAALVIIGAILGAAHHHRHAGMFGEHCPWHEHEPPDLPGAPKPPDSEPPPAH